MHALASLRPFRTTSVIFAALALAACGQGNGPDSIDGTLVPPPSCDSITFEAECPTPGIVNFNGGATTIQDNPDPSGINTSDRVARMQKFPEELFGGTRLDLSDPIDFSKGESYRVKVWSPRPVPVAFKLEELGNPEGGLTREQSHTGSGAWEELCFDFTGQNVPPPVVALTIIFDNGTLGRADTDPENWTFYYDDITQVESCDSGPDTSIIPDAALFVSEGEPDLVIPDDYAERTAFGSGSVIDPFYADDETYSPVLSVFSGTDYGANIAQVGFIGFRPGFLRRYGTVDFKVKGVPNQVVFVKLFDGVSSARVSLTRSDYSTDLGDSWFQVSIPLEVLGGAAEATGIVFESDDSAAEQFRMLLTDVGFSGTGDFVPADPGIIPDVTLYDRDGSADLTIPEDYAEISAFDSGADIETFTGDLDFSPALAVTTGFGYDIWNAQFAYLGFTPGFATSYETLNFKVKDLSGDVIRVKLLNDPAYVDINVTSSPYATALGNGWYQVSVPIADIPGAGVAEGLLFETISPPPEESFTYLITDIGFSGARAPADPGIVPEVVIYSSSAPADLVFGVDYTGFEAFGSLSDFDNNVTTDPDFSPVFGVTTGDGYGAQVGQFAIVGFAAGFASGYETLDFKAKGLNNDVIRVKFLDAGDYLDVVLTGSPFSTDLGNGWYQVSIPLTSFTGVDTATGLLFETDNTAASAFTFLLTDFGFSGSEGPASSPNSIIPENVLFATDPSVPVDFVLGVDYTGFDVFGSGSVYDTNYADDPGFNPTIAITSGAGYGANIAQFAIVGFDAGFAAGFGTLDFKIKGIPDDLIRVKFLDDGDYVDIDLATSEYSKELGSDWYQVSIPMTRFTGVDTATALLFESNNTSPIQFTFLLTDVGFSGTAGTDPGIVPDAVIYSSSAPADLVFGVDYTGFEAFGSLSDFDNNVTTDPDFSPVFGVTTGDGYGAQVGQFAIVGFAAGFASGYETLDFKAKGLNNDVIRVKFLDAGDYLDITLTSSVYSTALGNGWYQVSVPIADFTGVDTATGLLFETDNTAASAFTFLLTDFGFSTSGAPAGDIAVNGGFETGDFTGWQQFDGGGIQAIVTDNPAAGTYAANLNVPVRGAGDPGIDNLIKNANLEAGSLTPGAPVTVSFDMRGELVGAGGVVFAELFSELSGGGTSKAEILGGAPLAPTTGWATYVFDTTLGPDVSGGVTLQLKVGCGGVEGCGADVYFDNVSIVVN